MATDTEVDPHTRRARAGWSAFAKFIGLSTAAIVLVLALMAIFLL